MSYLEIKNLEISFPTPKGKYTAVRDINLSIKKGKSSPSLATRVVENQPS